MTCIRGSYHLRFVQKWGTFARPTPSIWTEFGLQGEAESMHTKPVLSENPDA